MHFTQGCCWQQCNTAVFPTATPIHACKKQGIKTLPSLLYSKYETNSPSEYTFCLLLLNNHTRPLSMSSSRASCWETTFICFFLSLLVCAIGFLAVTLLPASEPLVIFPSRPRIEVKNLLLLEIDSCGNILTWYSITLPSSSHPRETKVITFHVRLLHRERLEIGAAWHCHAWVSFHLYILLDKSCPHCPVQQNLRGPIFLSQLSPIYIISEPIHYLSS